MKFYILDHKHPKPVASKMEWKYWMELYENECIVNETMLNGNVLVSTIFTGCSSDDNPLVFETVILGGLHNSYSRKSETWKGAKNQHKDAVILVMAELN